MPSLLATLVQVPSFLQTGFRQGFWSGWRNDIKSETSAAEILCRISYSLIEENLIIWHNNLGTGTFYGDIMFRFSFQNNVKSKISQMSFLNCHVIIAFLTNLAPISAVSVDTVTRCYHRPIASFFIDTGSRILTRDWVVCARIYIWWKNRNRRRVAWGVNIDHQIFLK